MTPDLDEMIARFGWAVQGVFDPHGNEPPFAYTVGLTALGLPEIIVFGMGPDQVRQFLNMLGEQFRTTGVPALDTDLLDLAEGYPARLLPAPRGEADKYMHQARYRYPNYTAVQLVWCDKHRLFPWDAGYSVPAAAQPILRSRLQ